MGHIRPLAETNTNSAIKMTKHDQDLVITAAREELKNIADRIAADVVDGAIDDLKSELYGAFEKFMESLDTQMKYKIAMLSLAFMEAEKHD
jgi:hypothetical protein